MEKKTEYILEADDMTMTIINGTFKGSRIDNVEEIQKTLYKFGPMVVGIWGHSDNIQLNSLNNPRNRNNIISQKSFGKIVNGNQVKMDHDVLLVGWGTMTDTQYWILQNSWSEKHGYNGFFGIKIDQRKPHEYFYRYTYVKDIKDTSLSLDKQNIKNLNKTCDDCISQLDLSKFKSGTLSTSRTHGTTGGNTLPISDAEWNTFYANIQQTTNLEKIKDPYKYNFCWGSKDNWTRNSILIRSRSQGTCGSCWLFASISMIQSAISIHTILKYGLPFNVPLSEQWVLNNMPKLDGLGAKDKDGCGGGNADMLMVIVNGFKGLVGGRYRQHNGLGLIPAKDCTYKCSIYSQTGPKCFSQKCEQGPAFKSQSRKYTPPPQESPFVKNLKKLWKDNSTYIIIGLAVIVVLIIIFSMRK